MSRKGGRTRATGKPGIQGKVREPACQTVFEWTSASTGPSSQAV